MRALRTRVEKLERGSADEAEPFYILWVPAGADRVAALDDLRASGEIAADVSAYCAEWKPPESFVRNGRTLAPRPRSWLTNHQRISEEEVAVLFEAIGDDLESSGFISSANSTDDVGGQHRIREMTNRELIGAILTSSAYVRRLIRP